MSPSFRLPIRWFFLGSLVLSACVAFGLGVPLGAGAVLGYVTEKRVSRLLRWLKKPEVPLWRGLMSAAVILGVLLLVFLPVGIAVYVALQDLIRLITHTDWTQLIHRLERLIQPLLQRLESLGLETPADQLRAKATELLSGNVGAAGGYLGSALSSAPDAIFNVLILLMSWYVFATEGRPNRDRYLPQILPWPRVLRIVRETTADVIESVVIANIMVSAVQSLICTVPLVMLRVPRALVWGVLSFFLSFIPVFGTAPVTFGAALWCFSQGKTTGAIVMVVVGLFVGSVDNILRPLFMQSSKSELSTLWLFVALVGGISLFGISGVILGPLAFSLFLAFADALHEDDPVTPAKASEPPPSVPLTAPFADPESPAIPRDTTPNPPSIPPPT